MRRAIVSLVFDDGYKSVFLDVVPLLNRLHIPGTFAVCIDPSSLSQQTGLPVTSWQDWLSCKTHGHEIAAHSVHHVDLTKLSGTKLLQELAEPAKLLGATTLVYPGGAYNESVIGESRAWYSAGRGVRRGFNDLQSMDPMRLSTFDWTRSNWSVFRALFVTIIAILRRKWLIHTFHLISDEPPSLEHFVSLKEFTRFARLLRFLPVKVATINQVVHKIP